MKKLISIMLAIVMTVAFTVVPVQAATYPNKGQVMTLKNKITTLKDQGYSMDYEEMLYSVIDRFFNTYIPEDTTKGIDSAVLNYEKNAIAEIYTELLANVNAYEAGTKTPLSVTRTDMSNLTVNGKYIYDGNNPVFSIGYGFFGHAQADIPNFQSFGVNNIQMEIGPHQTWNLGSVGWNLYAANEGGTIAVTDTVARTGSKSLHINQTKGEAPNTYVAAERSNYLAIPCEPNTTYKMGVWAKGTAANTWCLWMKFGWDEGTRTDFTLSADTWTEYTRTITTGANQTSLPLLIVADNTVNAYLDDMYVYKEGSDVNLLANGGFEALVYDEVEALKIHLNNAQQNNVGVSLLLSPHYLKNIASANGVPTTSDSDATFINFDINHSKAKEIIEAHIRGVLSNVQDYTCIDSICISNEPWFDTRWFSDTYNSLFKQYAIEKHGSESAVKNLYGTTSIKMPTINTGTWFGINDIDANAYDWMEFNDKVFTEWHEWMADIVKEYFPNTPIHSKVMENIITSGETKERVELARGTDYEMFGEFSGYSGIDGVNYETADYYEMMFLYDYLQSAIGKPVYNSETHIIKDYYGNNSDLTEFSTNATKQALYKMWQGAIHGRSLSTVWAWQRAYADEAEGVRDFYGGLLFRPDLIAGLGKMNLDFARLSDKFVELQENSDKVAIFYSKPSRLWNASHITSVISVYKELIANGYDVGVVTEKSLAKLSEYDTLVIPSNTEYTTQAARTAVENFAAGGGKVLRGESDALTKSEYNKNLTANTISGVATYSTGALPSKAVTLKDASTGAAPTNVEWQYSVTDERILVNIANNSAATKNIDVYYNGTKLANLTELISDTNVAGTVTLNSYEPKLVEYTLTNCEPNEILDLTLDSQNGKITWKAVGENIGSVTIYKVNQDKSTTYLANTTRKEYVYSENGTYIVCPILKDGTQLEGKVLTTPSSVSMSVNRDGQHVGVALTNSGESYLRAKVLVEALVNGEVVTYGYARTFITPGKKHNINILLAAPIDAEVRVTVYDDINNILAQ